ncbi:phosphodiesterase [Olsenella urininfantis]|uniref:phosphodiesterase n=1 Tax=Olsenella urininfantis TaxID=1871033 RepID=UPI000985D95F|nr:phosphodiesterase [Olsenella urininfantis]
MKLLIASDIHGAAGYCEQLMGAIGREDPERVVLLGDLLYHGPRNDLPADYAPKQVISMLNSIAGKVIAVRGNCEAEVDQMVLDFPCMADCNTLFDPDATNPATGGRGRALFLTHGHVWGPGIHNSVDRMPRLAAGSAIVYGHTHKKVNAPSEKHPDIWCFNPGSVGIPKDGSHSFGIYENGHFDHRGL